MSTQQNSSESTTSEAVSTDEMAVVPQTSLRYHQTLSAMRTRTCGIRRFLSCRVGTRALKTHLYKNHSI